VSTKVGFALIAGRINTLANPRNKENIHGFGVPSPLAKLAGSYDGNVATDIGLDVKDKRIGGAAMNLTSENLIVDGGNHTMVGVVGNN